MTKLATWQLFQNQRPQRIEIKFCKMFEAKNTTGFLQIPYIFIESFFIQKIRHSRKQKR
jgi:hypothetical protein